MMSTVSNALSSLVMSLPLVAVPCLAIFGLPSIGPATAEADAEDAVELSLSDDLGAPSASLTEAPSKQAFAPIFDAKQSTDEQVAETAPGADRSQIAPTSDHRGASANQAQGLEQEKPAAPVSPNVTAPGAEGKVASAPPEEKKELNAFSEVVEESTSPSDWEGVLARLRELGIRKFHITDGEIAGQFYFCCSIDAAPNVVQRFEAEASSPTAAAIDVLAQVEQCQGIR